MSRRKARITAVELLYAADVRGVDVGRLLAERDDEVLPYAGHLALACEERRAELDELLRAASTRWPPERMAVVDRNILRVGVLELLEGEIPPPAVIDEAIEVAKRFSGEDSTRFVNGVLEGVRSRLQASEAGGS